MNTSTVVGEGSVAGLYANADAGFERIITAGGTLVAKSAQKTTHCGEDLVSDPFTFFLAQTPSFLLWFDWFAELWFALWFALWFVLWFALWCIVVCSAVVHCGLRCCGALWFAVFYY